MNAAFNLAKQEYENLVGALNIMADFLEGVARKGNISFSKRRFLMQYDCMLQYSLMQLAVSDASLDIDELYFIKDITIYSDFIDYINHEYQTNISWQTIWNSNEGEISSFLHNIRFEMDKIKDEFCAAFAFYDYLDEENDCLEMIKNKTLLILAHLSCVDGNLSPKEENSVKNNYIVDILIGIQNEIQHYTKNAQNPKSAPCEDGSLKSLYKNKVKKN